MWNGIPTRGLQESGVLHGEHWNWCCHELDHEPHGWSRCVDQQWFAKNQTISPWLLLFTSSFTSDWLQTFLPPWCCLAAALDLEPHPQRACLRSTWRPSSLWASAETRQPKHFEQRSDFFFSLLKGLSLKRGDFLNNIWGTQFLLSPF